MYRTFFIALKKILLAALACTSACAIAGTGDCSGPLPLTINLPAVSVPSSLAIGQTIPGAIASFAAPITCTSNPGADWYMTNNPSGSFTLVSGYTDVYTTSGMGAGIGFRMRSSSGTGFPLANYGATNGAFDIGPSAKGANRFQGTFELVKIGNATVGSFGFSTYVTVPNKMWANGNSLSTSTINPKFQWRLGELALVPHALGLSSGFRFLSTGRSV
jgi:hypothetical protein